MTTLSEFYRYKFDPSGKSPTNAVLGEKITILSPIAVPIPLHEGMFYHSSEATGPKILVIDNNDGRTLTVDVDFELIGLDHVLYARTGIECYAAIMLTNANYTGSLEVTYQCVGGPEGFATSFIKDLIASINAAKIGLSVDWESIKNKPTSYPPSLHEQPLASLTGFEDFADELQKLADTLVSRIPLHKSSSDLVETQHRMIKLQSEMFNSINAISLQARGITDYDNLVSQIAALSDKYDLTSAKPYDPLKVYETGEVCTIKQAGTIKYMEWYSNVEWIAGKDPALSENKRGGWSDATKPFYWIESTSKVAGETMWWGSDATPESMLVDTGQNVSAAVYWRLALSRPDLIHASDPSLISMPGDQGRYVRSADGSTYLAGNQHEDAIRNIQGYHGITTVYDNDFVTGPYYHGSVIITKNADGVDTGANMYPSTYTPNAKSMETLGFDASRTVPTAPQNQPVTAIEWKGLAI